MMKLCNSQRTDQLNNDNGLQQRTDRRPTGNTGFALVGEQCKYEHLSN